MDVRIGRAGGHARRVRSMDGANQKTEPKKCTPRSRSVRRGGRVRSLTHRLQGDLGFGAEINVPGKNQYDFIWVSTFVIAVHISVRDIENI